MTEAPPKKPHHHGDLRRALITAGIEILESQGFAALTLRKCAAAAGVSHAAPAHHFGGIDGLRGAIAAEGFALFRSAMLARRDQAGADPHDRVAAICLGYLDFARAHPALFELIFSFRPGSEALPVVDTAAQPAYDVLRETCAPFVPDGTLPEVIEVQVWSLVHGYAMLELGGRFPPDIATYDAQVLAALQRMPVATPPAP